MTKMNKESKNSSERWIIRSIVQAESGAPISAERMHSFVNQMLALAETNDLQLIMSLDELLEEADGMDQLPPFYTS